MIDKSVEFYSVILYKRDVGNRPSFELPEGYFFDFYKDGDELFWAEIEVSLGQFETIEEGIACFKREFLSDERLDPHKRVLFVKDGTGRAVATASLWVGEHLFSELPRFHWLAVSDECAGKGIAKALFSRLFELYDQLSLEGDVYLVTATRYYPAIAMYKKHFGFEFYEGAQSPFKNTPDERFAVQNPKAISIIEEKIKERDVEK